MNRYIHFIGQTIGKVLPYRTTSKTLVVVQETRRLSLSQSEPADVLWNEFKVGQEKHVIKINNKTIFTTHENFFNRHNFINNYFRWMDKIKEETGAKTENIMQSGSETSSIYTFDSPRTKGMKVLDKTLFSKSCKFPVIKVPCRSLKKTLKLIKSKLVRLPKVKPIAPLEENDPDFKKYKLCLLNPNVFKSGDDFSERERLILIELGVDLENIELYDVELGYENLTVTETIRAILPDDIPQSVAGFTQMGHLVHLNLKDRVLDYKHIIGEVILDKQKNATTVINKITSIDNTFRNFQLELLAGEPNYVATVKENGACFEFDFSKVYWNSRLGNEHRLIVDELNSNDVLYDVFAGVGPFAIPAAKKGVIVFANDLNPDSFTYLLKNVPLNKVPRESIKAYNMDGRAFITTIVKEDLLQRLGRKTQSDQRIHITMNLPAMALEFLDAFKYLLDRSLLPDKLTREDLAEKLPVIHCYCFTTNLEESDKDVKDRAEAILGLELPTEHEIRYVRNVAPNKEMMCLTFQLTPKILILFQEKSDESKSKKQKLAA